MGAHGGQAVQVQGHGARGGQRRAVGEAELAQEEAREAHIVAPGRAPGLAQPRVAGRRAEGRAHHRGRRQPRACSARPEGLEPT